MASPVNREVDVSTKGLQTDFDPIITPRSPQQDPSQQILQQPYHRQDDPRDNSFLPVAHRHLLK